MNENTKLKEWYTTNYPSDELGAEINPDSTFQNLFDALTGTGMFMRSSVWETAW